MRPPEDPFSGERQSGGGSPDVTQAGASHSDDHGRIISFPRSSRPEDANLRTPEDPGAAPAAPQDLTDTLSPDTLSPAAAAVAAGTVAAGAVAAGTGARRRRDLRIDAFRGLALATIFIDHVPGNPYEHATLRNFGFSDAAEGFFLMSGIAAGVAYSGRFLPETLRRQGLWAGIAPVWKRAWTLYLVQMMLTVWAIGIFVWGAQTFGLPQLLTQINLRQVFQNTSAALMGIPLLSHQLGYVNILPAYSVLLLATPAALWLGLRRPITLLGLSMVIWLVAGLWRMNLPNYPNAGGWFFNPFSWQLLFAFGLLTGIFLRRGERFVPRNRLLFGLCLGYLALALAWKFIPAVDHVMYGLVRAGRAAGVPFHIIDHDKTFLSLQRLFHVLSLAYVLSCMPVVSRASAARWAAPLRLMGRNGLLVFSLGTVLSLLFQVFMAAGAGTAPRIALWLAWGLPPLGLLALWCAAWINELARRPRGPRPDPEPAPVPPGGAGPRLPLLRPGAVAGAFGGGLNGGVTPANTAGAGAGAGAGVALPRVAGLATAARATRSPAAPAAAKDPAADHSAGASANAPISASVSGIGE